MRVGWSEVRVRADEACIRSRKRGVTWTRAARTFILAQLVPRGDSGERFHAIQRTQKQRGLEPIYFNSNLHKYKFSIYCWSILIFRVDLTFQSLSMPHLPVRRRLWRRLCRQAAFDALVETSKVITSDEMEEKSAKRLAIFV
jgi:hypothetical protein